MRQGRHEAVTRAWVVAGAACLAVVTVYAGARMLGARQKRLQPVFDYSDRSGFPRPPAEMRGIARNRGQSPVSAAMSP